MSAPKACSSLGPGILKTKIPYATLRSTSCNLAQGRYLLTAPVLAVRGVGDVCEEAARGAAQTWTEDPTPRLFNQISLAPSGAYAEEAYITGPLGP
jgi:hypothetical protein